MTALKAWIRKHPLEAALGGVLIFLGLVIALVSLISGDSTDDVVGAFPTETAPPLFQGGPAQPDDLGAELAGVEAIGCSALLTFTEVEEALDVVDTEAGLFQPPRVRLA